MNQPRIYADTSVIGGCLDAEFAEHSLRLIDRVRAGRIVMLLSRIVTEELLGAPAQVRAILESLPQQQLEEVLIDDEVRALRDAYLDAGILSLRWQNDATHVAAASVAGSDAIVSWNFRHIVRLDLMQRYNQVNSRLGYQPLTIMTPMGVAYE
jgi:predicted nucleic acid-binding protein